MTTTKAIEHILVERNISQKDLAESIGLSRQNFNTKKKRGSWYVRDITGAICKILNCELILRDLETGVEYELTDEPKGVGVSVQKELKQVDELLSILDEQFEEEEAILTAESELI